MCCRPKFAPGSARRHKEEFAGDDWQTIHFHRPMQANKKSEGRAFRGMAPFPEIPLLDHKMRASHQLFVRRSNYFWFESLKSIAWGASSICNRRGVPSANTEIPVEETKRRLCAVLLNLDKQITGSDGACCRPLGTKNASPGLSSIRCTGSAVFSVTKGLLELASVDAAPQAGISFPAP